MPLARRSPTVLRRTARPALLLIALGLLLALVPAGSAQAETRWVCRPDRAADPCRGSLTSTVLAPDGAVRRVQRTPVARRAPVDCFYVYPTVTGTRLSLREQERAPVVRGVARSQVGRYSSLCRVWAPAYRQQTLTDIGGGADGARRGELAYRDVRTAWRAYRRANPRRGVVLVGHSQGSAVLRRLVAEEVDRDPVERRRLIAAHLLGGDVLVHGDGARARGGDFRTLPACTRPSQTGCVVGFSTYGGPAPADSLFGRVGPLDRIAGLRRLCTNPARLGSTGAAALTSIAPVGPGDTTRDGRPVRTPWVTRERAYRARCGTAADTGATTLQVRAREGSTLPAPAPTPAWGLHLLDANVAQGDLLELAAAQSRAWRRARH